MDREELHVHRAAEDCLPIRRHRAAVRAVAAQDEDRHASLAPLRHRPGQQLLMQLRKVLANAILQLLATIHLERLQHWPHCR